MKQGLLIDMDGVIYSGEELIFGADKFIKKSVFHIQLRQIGTVLVFLQY